MTENRLSGYLDHIQQVAVDACAFAEGMDKAAFGPRMRSRAVGCRL